jgi:hypothetical protein
MEADPLKRSTKVLLALFIIVFGGFVLLFTHSSYDKPMLSFEQTMGIAFLGEAVMEQICYPDGYLNPKVKPFIIEHIGDAPDEYKISMVHVFSRVADSAEDVAFVESILIESAQSIKEYERSETRRSLATYHLRNLFSECMRGMGEMVFNGSADARALLTKMTYPKYWEENDIVLPERYFDNPYKGAFIAAGILTHLDDRSASYTEMETNTLELLERRFVGTDVITRDKERDNMDTLAGVFGMYLPCFEKEKRTALIDRERHFFEHHYESVYNGELNAFRD